jgi:hypothetical protein
VVPPLHTPAPYSTPTQPVFLLLQHLSLPTMSCIVYVFDYLKSLTVQGSNSPRLSLPSSVPPCPQGLCQKSQKIIPTLWLYFISFIFCSAGYADPGVPGSRARYPSTVPLSPILLASILLIPLHLSCLCLAVTSLAPFLGQSRRVALQGQGPHTMCASL